MGFDGLGDSNPLTGNLMFRARMGTINTPDFSSAFIIGIDANLDGQIDIFVGADNRTANGKAIKIWGGNCSKTPCNTSPSTTGLGTQVGSDIPETAANYNYTFVTSGFDVGNTNFDVDGDGSQDVFITFSVDYSLVANYLNTLGLVYPSGQGVTPGPVPSFDDHSPMRIIAVTSQQSNSFNQDLGGCAVINSAVNWTNCGMSSTFTPYQVDVPEPGTILLAGAGIASLLYLRRRKTQA
jgi:PEP-CTERM putative exosortase interaction domain